MALKGRRKGKPRASGAVPVMVMNVPELGHEPPKWDDVEAAFRGNQESLMLRTVLHMLAAQMATARRDHEGSGVLTGDARAWCDGRSDAVNEVMVWLLRLTRGDGAKVPGWVVEYFGGRKKEEEKKARREGGDDADSA